MLSIDEYDKIFLIVMDTVSARSTSIHNNHRDNTPFLENKAESNFVAKNAYSNAPWTMPAHASIFSGLNPENHLVSTKNLNFDSRSFVSDLERRGFENYCFSANYLISEETGFAKGFKEIISGGTDVVFRSRGYEQLNNINKDANGENRFWKYLNFINSSLRDKNFKAIFEGAKYLFRDKGSLERDNKAIRELVESRIEKNTNQFFFLNFVDAHKPYFADEEVIKNYNFDIEDPVDRMRSEFEVEETEFKWTKDFELMSIEDVRTLYAASIEYLDESIRKIDDMIPDDETKLVIVTSDHGEMIKHEGTDLWGHQTGIRKRLVEVPFVVWGDDIHDREEDLVDLKDIYRIMTGESKLSDISSKNISMSYGGLVHLAGDDFPTIDETDRSLLENKSKAMIFDDSLIVENTEIEDFEYELGL